MGSLIHSKRIQCHSYNERCLFLDGKLELNKTPNPNVVAATEFMPKKDEARVGGNQGGAHNMGLRPDTIQRQ
jgi:hypothetical protein